MSVRLPHGGHMTLGAHIVETTRVDAFCEAALRRAGLSWGNPATRAAFVDCLPFRRGGDSEAHAQDMASSQYCCGTSTMGTLQECGFSGTVVRFRGRPTCDPLREPYAPHYDAPVYLETLGQQRGLLQRPSKGEPPAIRRGSVLEIGGGPAYGGAAHIVQVIDKRDDGTLDTIEGGKTDLKNASHGTLITEDHRELYQRADGSWWLRDSGSQSLGRALRWWWWVGDLPMEPEAV